MPEVVLSSAQYRVYKLISDSQKYQTINHQIIKTIKTTEKSEVYISNRLNQVTIMYKNDPFEELEEQWSWDTIETDSAYYDSDDQKGNPMS